MGEAQIYQTVFKRGFADEQASLASLQRQLRLRYEDELAAEGEPHNTEKRQRAMERVNASRLHEEFDRACDVIAAEEERRDKLLDVLALKVEMKPDPVMHLIQVISNISFPQDQPAQAILQPLLEKLEGEGFTVHLRRSRHHFELWANCQLWMADALDRRAS